MIKIFLFLILIILLIIEPKFKSEPSINLMQLYIIIFIFVTLVNFKFNNNKNWFRIDLIFVFGFAIVNFQWPIMYSFSDISPDTLSLFWATSDYLSYMNYGAWLSTIGIVSWYLGFNLLKTTLVSSKFDYVFNYKIFFYFTYAMFILFILTAGTSYLSGDFYTGESSSSKASGISVYFQLLFSFSILLLLLIGIINVPKEKLSSVHEFIAKFDKKIIILLLITVLVYLVAGDRGGAIQPAFTFLILYGTFVKAISKKQFFTLILLGSIVLTTIGLTRGLSDRSSFINSNSLETHFSSGYDITLELANSARTLYKALSIVPKYHDYFYGKLWTIEILANIPLAQNLYIQITGDELYELSSSKFLTYQTRGQFSRWGEGTSLIADIYLNFALSGVIIFMLLLGILFKKITNEFNSKNNIFWIIAGTVLSAYAFYLSRGGIFYPLRPIVWSIILYVIFIKRKII